MFSGIVEEYATLVALVKDQENIHFTFKCSFVNELKIDQSVATGGENVSQTGGNGMTREEVEALITERLSAFADNFKPATRSKKGDAAE